MYYDKIEPIGGFQAPCLNSARSLTDDFVFLSQNDTTSFAVENCIDVLRIANRLLGQDTYSWTHYVSAANIASRAICGPKQTLVLVGGVHDPWLPSVDLKSQIRSSIRNAARVCIIGSAIFVPLSVGVLNTRKVAVHPNFKLGVREGGFRSDFSKSTTCHDNTLSSALSPVAAIQMMVELVGAREGEYTANALRNYLGLEASDAPYSSDELWRFQRLAQGNLTVSNALDIMFGHIEDTLTIGQIAEAVDVSPRQLERSFGGLLNCSPLNVYRALRLERAHKLLVQTALPVAEISIACGFSNVSLLGKWYRSRFGGSPAEARKTAYFGTLAA